MASWEKRFPEKRRAQQAALYVEQKAKKRLFRQENPERFKETLRRGRLRRNFGITLEQYDEMALRQRDRCAICKTKRSWRALAVDHCHKTGKVRALLCSVCNNQLGIYEKNHERFAEYLRGFK